MSICSAMSNIGILLAHFLPGWAGWSFRGVTICVAFVVGQVPVPFARNFVSLLFHLPGISPGMEKARLRTALIFSAVADFQNPPACLMRTTFPRDGPDIATRTINRPCDI
jgi:hypothetical protein